MMGKLDTRKEEMSGGTDSIQTSKGKDNLAFWAKAYATAFPCRLT